MHSGENRRTLRTKQKIREGLLSLLEKKALDEIPVTALCREAGINRATFYNHYTSPQAVLNDIEEKLAAEVRQKAAKPTSIEEAEPLLETICTLLYENAPVVRVLIRCKADGNFLQVLDDFYRHLLDMKNEIQKLRTLDEESLSLVSAFMGSGCYFLIRHWLLEENSKTPREVAALAYRLISAPALI